MATSSGRNENYIGGTVGGDAWRQECELYRGDRTVATPGGRNENYIAGTVRWRRLAAGMRIISPGPYGGDAWWQE